METFERDSLLINVAKLHYEYQYTQGMIAEKYGISRPFVSKLLTEAIERGIVTITVNDPNRTENRIEQIIRQKYELRRVIVVPNEIGSDARARACAAFGKYINTIIKSGDTVALGAGQTLNLSGRYLIHRDDLQDIRIVSMEGTQNNLLHSDYRNETVKAYADAWGGRPYVLPIPAFIKSAEAKKLIEEEQSVQSIRAIQREANIAIFTVSLVTAGKSTTHVRSGLFTEEEMQSIRQEGAISNCLFHFLNSEGKICADQYEKMNSSMPIEWLRQKEYRICISVGREKIEAIQAIINSGYANVLIIDENIAEALMY